MPVVIDEFEVVPAAEAAQDPIAAAAAAQTPTTAAGPTPPQEIERVVRRMCERAARLRAH